DIRNGREAGNPEGVGAGSNSGERSIEQTASPADYCFRDSLPGETQARRNVVIVRLGVITRQSIDAYECEPASHIQAGCLQRRRGVEIKIGELIEPVLAGRFVVPPDTQIQGEVTRELVSVLDEERAVAIGLRHCRDRTDTAAHNSQKEGRQRV